MMIVVNLGVEDFRNLKFQFIIDNDWGRVECDQESDLEFLVPTWKCGKLGVQHGDYLEVIG